MKKILALLAALLLTIACSTQPTAKTADESKPFFDIAKADALTPGQTTREEVRATLGEPYPDPLKTDERWTYMYTYQRQLVLIFKSGVLVEKKWSEEHGIGIQK